MTPPSTALTTSLKDFGLTKADEELVPRLTQAGHHDALQSGHDTAHGSLSKPAGSRDGVIEIVRRHAVEDYPP